MYKSFNMMEKSFYDGKSSYYIDGKKVSEKKYKTLDSRCFRADTFHTVRGTRGRKGYYCHYKVIYLEETKAISAQCRFTIYDNKGKTIDHYTVLDNEDKTEYTDKMRQCLGLAESPKTYSQFCTATLGRHLGKKVNYSDLPEKLREHILERFS